MWPEAFDVQDMSLTVVDRITDRVDLDSVSLCGTYGDPIYHRRFHDAAEIMVGKGLNVFIATNGSYRNIDWWTDTVGLLKQTESIITFSIDGLEDTNPIYRVNSRWEDIEAAARYCAPRIDTRWKFIVFSHNQHQIDDARIMADQWGVKFQLVHSQRFGSLYGYRWDEDPMKPDEKYVHRRNY